MTNILVLGADGVGKDALCQELLKGSGYEAYVVRKFPERIPVDAEEAYTRAMEVLSTVEPNNCQIWNRFYFPDDLIYGRVIRGDPPELTKLMGELFLAQILPQMVDARFRVVLLTLPYDVTRARGGLKASEAEGDELGVYQDFPYWKWKAIADLYRQYTRDVIRYALPTEVWDTSRATPEALAKATRWFCLSTGQSPLWEEGRDPCSTLASCLPR